MTRFLLTTLAAAAALVVVGVTCAGPTRLWLWAGVGAVYLAFMVVAVSSVKLGFFCKAVCRGAPGRARVALTFDDGPDPHATPALLDALRLHQVPATFFCVGRAVLENRDLIRRTFGEGHLVANHTMRHAWWTNFLAGRPLQREIEAASDAIRDVLGAPPRYFRSPAGLTNPHLAGALKRAGLTLVGWDVRGLDTCGGRPERVVRRVLKKTRDGSIVVLHDGGAKPGRLLEIAGGVIAALRARGFSLVRLDELLDERRGEDAP